MTTRLADFLGSVGPAASTHVHWGRLGLQFRVNAYVSSKPLPPEHLITSVRAIVCVGKHVIALENRDGTHILPGGRLEAGETYLAALHREIEEETGLVPSWTSDVIGFLHFHHLTPRPADYAYPYPDMFHLVFVAEASGEPRSGDIDGYEERAFLVSRAEALTLTNNDFAQPLLHAALAIRHGNSA